MADLSNLSTEHVYDVAITSPLQLAPKLTAKTGCQVYLKREDLQPVNSFKLRGAHNKIAQLSPHEMKKGVIAASAGNHAQGVALSAQKLGIKAKIVMPRTTPEIKVEAVKSYGAKVILRGDNYSESFEHSQKIVKDTGGVFIHPFDDPLVIAGQGTIGAEIMEQNPETTHIFVPIGGGGLIAGIAQYVKSINPKIKIIGVEPIDSNAMGKSLESGKRIILKHVGIFADGVAVKQVGANTFDLATKYVDQVVTVSNDQICAAIKSIYEDTRCIVEPAGALAVAGIQQYKLPKSSHAVAICSGANMSFERLQFVAERTLVGSGREALFAVKMPELPGALQKFCTDVTAEHSITEFSYRLESRSSADIFVGISISSPEDKNKFMQKMLDNGYTHQDLSDDDLTKQHIRHMIGGKSNHAKNEKFYEVSFPERPGALGNFLSTDIAKWNISLFHYRGQGSDTGSVMIGFEVPDDEVRALETLIAKNTSDFKRVKSLTSRIFLEES